MSSYREIFEAELDARGIIWCRGASWRSPGGDWFDSPDERCSYRGGKHTNSSAWATREHGGTIHLGGEVATRARLQIALHEVAHHVLGHVWGHKGKRVYQIEAEAEEWSFKRMRELGVPVPRKARQRARAYIAHKKRRGDKVIAARRKGTHP